MAGSDVADRMRAMFNIFCQRTHGFNICSLNARSLRPKIDELSDIFAGSDVHAILVCESWLHNNIPSSLVHIPGYRLFRNDRRDRRGGGVAVFIKDSLKSRIVGWSRVQDVEFICVEVDCGGDKCILSAVYCPPEVFSLENASEFADALSDFAHRYRNVILGGDINVNLLRQSSSSNSLRFLLQSLNLHAVNTLPTYFNAVDPSQLDIFATTDPDAVLFHNQLSPPSVFDHDFLFLAYNFGGNHDVPAKSITFRDFDRIDIAALHDECAIMPWSCVDLYPSVDDQVTALNSIILYLLDRYAPLQSRVCIANRCPWFSAEIRHMISERDFLYRRYMRNKTDENRSIYKRMRNATTTKIRDAKRRYFSKRLDPDLPPRKLWSNLRSAGVHGATSAECDIDPNILNVHFTSSNSNAAGFSSGMSLSSSQRRADEFSFRCVDAGEVVDALKTITSEATGPDDIPPRFLKLILPWVLSPILRIFNTALTSSQFPEAWKVATVLPLAKNTSACRPNDFRPISILCFLSKVLEKLIYKQILQHLESNSLLTRWQSGFRAGHSCETALLKVTSDIRKSLDNNRICVLALLDFSKAFDSVNHSRLLSKLVAGFGFSTSSAALIRDFLTNRYQQVKIGDKLSEMLSLKCGVPQGSILGPLLFCIYVNDLPEVVRDSKVHLYADDVQIYLDRPLGLIEDCVDRLNSDLMRISEWSVINHLLLNPRKSKCMVLCREQLDTSGFPDVLLNDVPLPLVNDVCNLGIVINSTLTCCNHIKAVLSKIYGTLRRLWLSAGVLPVATRLRLVKSLLLPHFISGSIIYPRMDSICRRRLNIAFNDCIRFIYGLRRYDHITSFRCSVLGLSLDDYLSRRGLLFLHKLIYKGTPAYLLDDLCFLASSRHLKLRIPRYHYPVLGCSHLVSIVRLWNELPANIQRIGSASFFKKLVTIYLTSENRPTP